MVTGDVKRWQAGLSGAVVSPRRADSGLPGERGIFQLMSVSGKKRPPGYCGTDWPESPNRYVEDRLAPQEGAEAEDQRFRTLLPMPSNNRARVR